VELLYWLLFNNENYNVMSCEIEIESQDDDLVVFYILNTAYQVEIETQIGTEKYPVSFNSVNENIVWAESDTIYFKVKEETLACDGINYYNDKDLCEQLETLLNEL
jgi:hypothetical protein